MLAVDVGGTFTDFAHWEEGNLSTSKRATSEPQSDAVIEGAQELLDSAVSTLLHGTTVATNALLQRAGARVSLVTNRGVEDVIEIGRQDRPSLYDASADRPHSIVPRERRFGVTGRMDHRGRELTELNLIEPDREGVRASQPETLAISLLNSYANPAHEVAVAEWLSETMADIPMSLSSSVTAEFREYERAATTALNAYLVPVVSGYLSDLENRLASARLAHRMLVMRSSGGLLSVERAAQLPAAIVLSGPAGGAVAAAAMADVKGLDRVISLDMGGTSTDVSRIEAGRPTVGYQREVAGLPCRLPSIAIHTVGAGGGSIAWQDAGGALRVGPKSAGATPGPAVYGRGGTDPTVTDAHVVLGNIGPRAVMGGRLPIDSDLGAEAFAHLRSRLDMELYDVARGVIEIADSRMEKAIRAVSIEEGADPRPAFLVPFGGAGGLHAVGLAQRLDMRGVLIPPHSGIFSALGLLLSPLRADAAQTMLGVEPPISQVRAAVEKLAESSLRQLGDMGRDDGSAECLVDLRYRGQAHETTVSFQVVDTWSSLAERFHVAHADRNGFARRGDPVELVTLRAVATADSQMTWSDLVVTPNGEPERGSRPVMLPEGPREAKVYWRPALAFGSRLTGPAVIEEPNATTLVPPDAEAVVLDDGSIEVSW